MSSLNKAEKKLLIIIVITQPGLPRLLGLINSCLRFGYYNFSIINCVDDNQKLFNESLQNTLTRFEDDTGVGLDINYFKFRQQSPQSVCSSITFVVNQLHKIKVDNENCYYVIIDSHSQIIRDLYILTHVLDDNSSTLYSTLYHSNKDHHNQYDKVPNMVFNSKGYLRYLKKMGLELDKLLMFEGNGSKKVPKSDIGSFMHKINQGIEANNIIYPPFNFALKMSSNEDLPPYKVTKTNEFYSINSNYMSKKRFADSNRLSSDRSRLYFQLSSSQLIAIVSPKIKKLIIRIKEILRNFLIRYQCAYGRPQTYIGGNKIISCDQPIKVNIGSGGFILPNYINVDASSTIYGVSVVQQSPYILARDNSVSEIYLSHVLEHFPRRQLRSILKNYYYALSPGGKLRLSVPNFQWFVDSYNEGLSLNILQDALYGGQDYFYNFHMVVFDYSYLSELLESAGFSKIDYWDSNNFFNSMGIKQDSSEHPCSLNIIAIK